MDGFDCLYGSDIAHESAAVLQVEPDDECIAYLYGDKRKRTFTGSKRGGV